MKSFAALLLISMASLCCSQAQVTVKVELSQDEYLPGESLVAAVRITNRSGQTLRLGTDPAWLTFSIQTQDGRLVMNKANVPVVGEFSLESSKYGIKRVDIAPYYDFPSLGRYSITATVTFKAWNQQITSDPVAFNIIQGSKLWQQEIGVPLAAGATNRVPELRTYVLHQANYLRKRLTLYVEVLDSTGRPVKVFPIGPMLSFGQPDPQVDKFSNLHVLYQNGPRSFSYTVINPDGDVITRQTYDFTTRPRMKVSEDGAVSITGGARRIMPNDVPAAKSEG